MATHSSILAWNIPWTEEPHRLQTMGSKRVGHNWAHIYVISFAEELKNSFMCIPWGKTWILSQGCTIVSSLLLSGLCIPSLPWLATVWTYLLELRRGHGGWNLFPTNRKWETQKNFLAQKPHRVLLGFMFLVSPETDCFFLNWLWFPACRFVHMFNI